MPVRGTFQHRQTGIPGAMINIQDPNLTGEYVIDYEPNIAIDTSLSSTPKMDDYTRNQFRELSNFFKDRKVRYPNEGFIFVDPSKNNSNDTLRHEAAHSLYNQSVPGANESLSIGSVPSPSVDILGDVADMMGLKFNASHPNLRGTEAAAQRLFSLYMRQKGSLAK